MTQSGHLPICLIESTFGGRNSHNDTSLWPSADAVGYDCSGGRLAQRTGDFPFLEAVRNTHYSNIGLLFHTHLC